MKTLFQAVATEEGFYKDGSRAQRNNNPGNINMSPLAAEKFKAVLETIPHGYSETARFAHYPDEITGFEAMKDLFTRKLVGLTLNAALEEWAPSSENNHPQYVNSICEMTGYTSGIVITYEMLA
jgi:hypothetical protein